MSVCVKEVTKPIHPSRNEPLTLLESYRLGLTEPKFRGSEELSSEQLTDPHYAKKQLEKLNGGKLDITCSKCHHCR